MKNNASKKEVMKFWIFQSDSNPDNEYQTLLYYDGTTSCDCPGWTRRSVRSCKHTRWVECGLADSKAKATKDSGSKFMALTEKTVQASKSVNRRFNFD